MNKDELKACLKLDYERNIGTYSLAFRVRAFLSKNPAMARWRFLKAYRLSEYHTGILQMYYLRRKNKLGMKLGYEFLTGCKIGPGLQLCHRGPVIINGCAQIGKCATMRGSCCIGNDGKTGAAPVIGDYVEFGYDCAVIGDIRVADHTWVAAGAVVTKDILEPWTAVGGVPAKQIAITRQNQI
ncbi:MAG: serine acetyltransferase [Blautia sp.]|nr:serine acetyltransferase [Blautia sp.]